MDGNRQSHTPTTTISSFTPLLIASGIVAIFLFSISLWAWGQLPADAQIPVHWGVNGQPDRYGGKWEGLLLMPMIFVGVIALLTIIPRIDPRSNNILNSQGAYQAFWWMFLVFFAGLHVALVLNILGYNVNIGMITPAAVGMLFVVLGRYMGRIRSNFMFGIRTPWTLTSELSWQKTHLWGGRLFMLLGVLLIISGLFPLSTVWFGLFMGGIIGLVVGLFVYSYLIWKDDPNASRQR